MKCGYKKRSHNLITIANGGDFGFLIMQKTTYPFGD
jgi:hypothetical protein